MAVLGITACGNANESQTLSSLEYEQELETTDYTENETKESGSPEVDVLIETIVEAPVKNPEKSEELYFLAAAEDKNNNAVFCINGYLYKFCLDIDTHQMDLEVGSLEEEKRYRASKIFVFPCAFSPKNMFIPSENSIFSSL